MSDRFNSMISVSVFSFDSFKLDYNQETFSINCYFERQITSLMKFCCTTTFFSPFFLFFCLSSNLFIETVNSIFSNLCDLITGLFAIVLKVPRRAFQFIVFVKLVFRCYMICTPNIQKRSGSLPQSENIIKISANTEYLEKLRA